MSTSQSLPKFKKVDGEKIPDVKQYVVDYLYDKPDAQVFIGCDSKVRTKYTYYVTVIVLYTPGKGGHVIYSTESGKKLVKEDIFPRLWHEVELSAKVAEVLQQAITKPITVHIDISTHEEHGSNIVHRAATGFLKGMGMDFKSKPEAWAAMRAADMLTRHNRYLFKEETA